MWVLIEMLIVEDDPVWCLSLDDLMVRRALMRALIWLQEPFPFLRQSILPQLMADLSPQRM